RLTMARYGRAHLHDLAATVANLPSLLPQGPETAAAILQPTGTEGGGNKTSETCPQSIPYRPLTEGPDRDPLPVRLFETTAGGEGQKANQPQTPTHTGFEAGCDRLTPGDSTSGGWDRTSDTRLMKPLL